MKSTLIVAPVALCAALTLSGCARFSERSYGSWLDTYGMPQPTTARISPEEAKSYQAESERLSAQAEEVRVKLASEKNRVQRIAYLKELREIGDRQAPLDQALHYGLTPMTPPTQQPSDPGA